MLENSHLGFGTALLAPSLVILLNRFQKKKKTDALFGSLLCRMSGAKQYKTHSWSSGSAGFALITGSLCVPATTFYLY